MSEPFFSCVCVTYARTKLLSRAVECFLRQTYPGPKELVILNTCPEQELVANYHNVRIINLDKRPTSIGAARNLAVASAEGTHIVTWDDDDYYFPWHLQNYANYWEAGYRWVVMATHWHSERGRIIGLAPAGLNTLAFHASVWEDLGGYEPLHVGEDAAFMSRLNQFPGAKLTLQPEEVSFVYGWKTGYLNLSEHRRHDRSPEKRYEQIGLDAKHRMETGLEPSGRVLLRASDDADFLDQRKKFITDWTQGRLGKSVAIVQLGAAGDIINILPVAKWIADRYAKPSLIVAEQYAEMLQGVSYVNVVPALSNYRQPDTVARWAAERFRWVFISQIYGDDLSITKQCESFTQESWRMVGCKHLFETTLMPVFDCRNQEREKVLCRKLLSDSKPNLLMNLTASRSTPVAAGPLIRDMLVQQLKEEFNIIDLGEIVADRFYDLLGLMERSAALVSLDTGLIHLAAACGIPVVVLNRRRDWAKAIARSNVVREVWLDEVLDDVAKLADAVRYAAAQKPGCRFKRNPPRMPEIAEPRYIHAVEMHLTESQRGEFRFQKVFASWNRMYADGVIPCHYTQYRRNSMLEIGDTRSLPYLKDVLNHALSFARPDDVIILTNDDTVVSRHCLPELKMRVALYDAVCSRRCDWKNGKWPARDNPEDWLKETGGHVHSGRDLFAFKAWWLRERMESIPDYILGAPGWDYGIAAMIRLYHGHVSDGANIWKDLLPSEMPPGFIGHIYHTRLWTLKEHRTAPASVHNYKLLRQWNESNGCKFIVNDDGVA